MLILAISSEGLIFWSFRTVAGTSIKIANACVDYMCSQSPAPDQPSFRQLTLLGDNLPAHWNAEVRNTAIAYGHRFLPRPRCRPCDGSIEWAFNQIENGVQLRCFDVQEGMILPGR